MSLGISFSKGSVEEHHAVNMIIIFCCSTPLGIAGGWLLAGSSDLLEGVFMSIAAGTFIYIAASEIVVEEFAVTRYKWIKYLFFSLGIIPMSAFLYFTDKS